MKSFGIIELLRLRGFDATLPTKFVRHQDKRWDVNDLMRRDWLDFYQATQGKPIFDHCNQIVSFIGAGGTKARFIGVYRVVGPKCDGGTIRPPKGYPLSYLSQQNRETVRWLCLWRKGNLGQVGRICQEWSQWQ